MDKSRKQDLEELMVMIHNSKNSYQRDHYEAIVDKIMRESGEIREVREELIQAIRSGDRRHVRYVQEHIRKIRFDETGGKDI
jgi:NTP pyrophosphatase (non-canonical NTP hydrolase)